MTGRYKILIRVWPGQTGDGKAKDQERVGPEKRQFEVDAQDFADAHNKAKMIVVGIKSNPWVWEVPIESISYLPN